MSEALSSQAQSTRRRPWSRRLTPAQIRALAEKYYAGSSVQEVMREFGICRSSLYRYLRSYDGQADKENDVTHWRIEYERLKNLCVELAFENKTLRNGTVGQKDVSLGRSL